MPDFNPSDLGCRFELLELLGGGGSGGAVLRCLDQVMDREVAIKVLPPGTDPEEFRALRSLQHPGVVDVLDQGRTLDGGRAWFSMAMLDGVPFGPIGGEIVPAKRWARRVARLLEALAFLHDRGWIHADLKPDNVFVPNNAPDSVVLLDFGLALRTDAGGGLRGTVGFIAPEVLNGDEPGAASDLYAVGVMAATALSGDMPFAIDDPNPGLVGPAPSGWLGEQASEPARRWVAGMVQRNPTQRPASAREALAQLEAAVGLSLADPNDSATRIAPVPPLGRDDVFEELATTARDGGLAIILGPRGAGRSAILQLHADRLRGAGLDAPLLRLGSGTARSQRALRAYLGDRTSGEAIPPDPADFSGAAELGGALRVYEASLAVDLGSAIDSSTGALLVDDVDADTLAGRATLRALEQADPPCGLLIAGNEVDEQYFSHLMERRSDPRDILVRLRPLELDEVRSWLGQALGNVVRVADLASRLHEATRGLPGPLHRLTERLLRERLIHPGEREWRWDEVALDDALDEAGQTAPAAMRGLDVERLVANARRDADLLAEQGEAAAARRGLARVVARAERIGMTGRELSGHWLRLSEFCSMLAEEDEAVSWLQRIREAEGVDPHERAAAIVREAESLQTAARFQASLDLVAEHAELVAAEASSEERALLEGSRGTALLRLARYDEARRTADEARDSLTDISVRARLALYLISANADWHQGRHSHAEMVCRSAAGHLGATDDGPTRAALETTLATSLRLQGRLDDAALLYMQARERYRERGRILDCARVANNLGIVLYLQGQWLDAIDAFEDFRDLVRRADNPGEIASAWNNLGNLYRDTGQLERAEDAFDRSLELARRHRFARLEPMVLGNLAECSAVRGRSSLAEGQYAECIALSVERGIRDETVEAWRRLAAMRLDSGELDGCERAIEEAYEAGAGDLQLEATLLSGLGAICRLTRADSASVDDAEAAIDALEKDGSTFEAARMRLRYAAALVQIDKYAEAEEQVGLATKVCEPLPARPELARADELRQFISAATRNRLDTVTAHYDALQDLTLAVSRERDLSKLLETVLDRTLALVGEDRGYVMLVDQDGEPTVQASRALDPKRIDAQLHSQGPSKTVIQRVIETRKPLAALDLDTADSLREQMSVVASGVRSVICVPILRGDDVLGVLYVDSTSAVGGSAEHKASLLMAAADAASVAIENARLIEALRQKNDSIAIMAHELRTPLASIVGFASVMLDPESLDEGEDEELLGIIKREAERSSEMINRVLQLARMEAGQLELPREIVDPLYIVVSATSSLKPLAVQAEVVLDADADTDVPDIIGDSDRLVQVAVNLVGNAVKFSPRGGTVRIRAHKDGDDMLRLVVEDEGPGIPDDRLGEIFEAYQQAGPKGMRSEGVGLGLAICRQIVRQHQGTIRAENRSEGGARFTVRLPTSLRTSTDVPMPD